MGGASVKGYHQDAVEGRLESLRSFLETPLADGSKPDINAGESGDGNYTYLHYAAREGWLHLVKYLTESGANVNEARGFFEETPTTVACRDGRLEVVRYLGQHHGNFEHRNLIGLSVMAHAIAGDSSNSRNGAKFVKPVSFPKKNDRGKDNDCQEKGFDVPVSTAQDELEMLCSSVSEKKERQQKEAQQKCQDEIQREDDLTEQKDESPEELGSDQYEGFVDRDYIGVLRYLIEEKGASPNQPVMGPTYALAVALTNSSLEAVRTLLEFGADPTKGNPVLGYTCLHCMAELEKLCEDSKGPYKEDVRDTILQRFQMIINDSSIDVDALSKSKDTALTILVKQRVPASYRDLHVNAVKYLVESASADVSVKNGSGCNAFLISCSMGHEDLFNYFLDMDAYIEADTRASNFIGNNALHCLVLGKALSFYAKKNTSSPTEDMEKFQRMIKKLCASGVNINSSNLLGFNCLHLIVSVPRPPEEIKYQCQELAICREIGCSVEAVDMFGQSPMDKALALVSKTGLAGDGIEAIVSSLGGHSPPQPDQGDTTLLLLEAPSQNEIARRNSANDLKEEVKEEILAEQGLKERFLRDCAPHMGSEVKLSNTVFLSKMSFLELGRFTPYQEVIEKDLLVRGDEVPHNTAEVLFISHRWASSDLPDPDNIQFLVAKAYLEHEDKKNAIEYVWLDYSCISQDLGSDTFKIHLQNIPTALFVSSKMLIIPAVAELGSAQFIPSRGPMGLACSNLADYLMRAWCQFEVLVGLFGNSSVTIAYQIGRSLQDKEKHQKGHFDQDDASEEKKEDPVEGPPFIDTYDPKNGAISFQQVRNVSCSTIDLGFTSASYETLRGSITGGDGGLSMLDIMPEATLSRISAKLLNCLEPTQLLSALLNFGNTLYHEDQAAFSMIQSCVDFDIQKLSTYRSGKWAAQVNKIYALLGVCAVENDKNVVLCLLLACTSFLVSQTQRYAS